MAAGDNDVGDDGRAAGCGQGHRLWDGRVPAPAGRDHAGDRVPLLPLYGDAAPTSGADHQTDPGVAACSASISRVGDLFALETATKDGPRRLPAGPLAVDVDHVSFGYVEGDLVLEDISLHLHPGRVLGLLGRTGSGKTAAGRLFVRVYDPTAGAVRLGGMDIRDVPLADLRHRVGVVTQDVQLFHASVRDNLTFFHRGISDARLMEVLRELGLVEWIESLPLG